MWFKTSTVVTTTLILKGQILISLPKVLWSSNSKPRSIFVVDAVSGKLTRKEESLSQISLKPTSQIEMRKNNMSIFGFQYHNKVDGIPNITLPLIITTTIVNHFISGMLMDDEGSFNLIYVRVFTELGLSKQDLEPCESQSLIAYNDSSTRPYR